MTTAAASVPSSTNPRVVRAATAGFALGPIILAIALTAVLAFAYSYANRTQSAASADQSNRTVASTLVTVGDNLLTGYNIMLSKGFLDSDILFNGAPGPTTSPGQPALLVETDPNAPKEIFSPGSGGTNPPARPELAMAGNATTDVWLYTKTFKLTDLGTGSSSVIALLPSIKLAICQQINNLLYNDATTATPVSWATSLANLENGSGSTATVPTSNTPRPEACIATSDGAYVYYKTLAFH